MANLKEIYDLAADAGHYITRLEAIGESVKAFKRSIEDLRQQQYEKLSWEIEQVKLQLQALTQQLQKYGLPGINEYEQKLTYIRELLQKEEWPAATPPEAICGTNPTITNRAENIIQLVVGENLQGTKFLDFGCGLGHTAHAAHKRGTQLAVGYDLDVSQCSLEGPFFTSDFNAVKENGPYDIILAHDVLDHIKVVDPIEALKMMRSVLTRHGKIYLRNHPWSSRHGGHLYEQINKAFLHLVLDETELMRIGGWACEHNIKVVRPLDTYRHWCQQAALDIESELPIKQEVERFFLRPSYLQDRLLNIWKNESEMASNLEIEWVEYVLTTPALQIF